MGTRAIIGVIKKTESEYEERSIYLHWDGYPSYAGKILFEHYPNLKKVESLIALGGLSSIREKLNPRDEYEHSFDAPQEGVCVAYHRDRGEPLDIAVTQSFGLDYLLNQKEDFIEYRYCFVEDEGIWYVNGEELEEVLKS